jgi:hypothetical protein
MIVSVTLDVTALPLVELAVTWYEYVPAGV